jgi:DNA polymerase-3 subunit gamma/tau
VLTTTHETSLLPTLRSRLRPYRFARRDAAAETDVIRRVFRDNAEKLKLPAEPARLPARDGKGLVQAYLESFLPVSAETLHPAAAFFAASVAMGAATALRRRNLPLPETLTCLGKHCAPIAEAAGFGRPIPDTASLVTKVLSAADRFDTPDSFNQFLNALLSLVSESLAALSGDPGVPACRDTWSKKTAEAASSSAIYNLTPALVLDRLSTELRQAMVSQIKV